MKTPFVGMVDASGRLDPDVRGQIAEYIRTFAGLCVEVKVAKYKVVQKRSLDQNAWIWGVAYPLLAETLGYDKDEIPDMHYALIARCFGTHVDERLGTELPNKRSSKLTTAEFSEYMEWLVRFAAKEFSCVIPLPDEVAV